MDFLTIKDDGKLILESDGKVPVEITEENMYDELPESFMVSSSIDFPEEFTDDEKVIALCRKIRPYIPILEGPAA
jgi:hypothetical protein